MPRAKALTFLEQFLEQTRSSGAALGARHHAGSIAMTDLVSFLV